MAEMDFTTPEELGDQYLEFVRPRVARLLKLLKLDLVYDFASGDHMNYLGGDPNRPILDLLGGYGSTLLGHNHPKLVRALKQSLEQNAPVHAQASIRPTAAGLARKLNHLMVEHGHDPRRFVVTLCNSGAEAVEAGLKHALMDWHGRREALCQRLETLRADRLLEGRPAPGLDERLDAIARLEPVIVAIEGSFHGKTAGSVSVTTNLDFKGMYATSPIRSLFLAREESLESASSKLASCLVPAADDGTPGFSAVAAILFEAIQGEGGIQCLTPAFGKTLSTLASGHGCPLIADEIQCGLFRTGEFLAAHAIGIRPDYVLLGKGLGGGLAKVSALLVDAERYVERFGFIHTSTFAEDELSSRVASETLDLLALGSRELKQRAAEFEAMVRARVERIQANFPGVLNEVRGRGFLLGIEFNFGETAPISTLMHTIHQAGFASYIYSSYLLHRHRVRCGVTLSKPDTLRIEPSLLISEDDTRRFLDALEELCAQAHQRKLVVITRHFWDKELTERALQTSSPVRFAPVGRKEDARRIGFFAHMIDDTHFKLIDPFMRAIGQDGVRRFETKFGAIAGPLIFHEQLIEGANGARIHLHCYGLFLGSRFFEESHRAGDGHAAAQVRAMAERARRERMELAGLGQYTSIVTRNGLLLERSGLALTTGNGLTAGYACQAIQQLTKESGLPLTEARVGVVGAAGNICGVITQLLADDARELTLVFREGTEESRRARQAVDQTLRHSRIDASRVRVSGTLDSLRDCDVVVVGTNAAAPVLRPEHLKQGALVMDVSVPTNIDPRVFAERPDVRCYQGGRARLPLGQKLKSDWLPVPAGETYACMGETISAGLSGHQGHLSFGLLTKQTVLRSLELAASVGMEMGSLRRVTRA